MRDDELGEFKVSKEIQKKLNDKEWLQKEFAKGRTAQEIMGFSDDAMAKFYHAAYHLFEKREVFRSGGCIFVSCDVESKES